MNSVSETTLNYRDNWSPWTT